MWKAKFAGYRNESQATVEQAELNLLLEYLKTCESKEAKLPDIPATSPLFPVVEQIELAVRRQQEINIRALLELNKAVTNITGYTSVKDMLIHIKEQTDHLTNMAAQAEEMGASVNDMAATTSKAANFVEHAVSTAGSGVEKVEQALTFVENSFSKFEKVSHQVEEVLNSMSEIDEIVGVIAGVADQTNLLALNAAIEAARAGEHGRGFAVVADEVRKLAEYTKNSVNEIKLKIDALSRSSRETAKSIDTVNHVLSDGRDIMRDAGQSIETILHNISAISDNITQIAAGSQEQSAVVEEFSGSVNSLAQSAEATEKFARSTGKQIFDASKYLGVVRRNRLKEAPTLSTYDALELAKTDHYLFTWRIYNMLLDYEKLTANKVVDHHSCRLGQWMESDDAAPLRSTPQFAQLNTPHRLVHEYAIQAVQAYQQGDIARADQLLSQVSAASKQVVEVLESLQRIVK